ncbi:phosphoribosylaminoimidazolecarboxamide formyltransferase [Desulfatibacillum aliphaticivorans]|uniref:Phosphoribosylaminoimidazolecarboxamide formyltransferase n=1 Tax=Desulfatibacillum aliphaticivorans TaxID=218208 RepID=B8FDY6_DESAL|nr:phosphoribosylaminoimidazolecarboxamide formyltransferase [Desulfatibacillum aliphaticivorans]ACL06767.1 Phosphoribosylaminoimidazolecarboxamide formyltransferase [Desulfatibacillum aliphaticivorans]
MAVNVVDRADDPVQIKHVLMSVSDKTGLETFVPGLLEACPGVKIFSTGGTYNKIAEILGDKAKGCLEAVSDYTGQPETQGGLVKTLDFKIYLGLLTETYNDSHQSDLKRTNGVPIDMVVVNLYPFRETIAQPKVTPEMARGQIDIGGPCMIRASAKNFLRVSSVVDPDDYPMILDELKANSGSTTMRTRYRLARKAFRHTASYDKAIADYLQETPFDNARPCYKFED